MKRFQYWWIPVIIILLDQATKLRVKHVMQIGESISVIGDFFRLTFVTNDGGAFSFSIGDGSFNRIFFIIVPFLALFLIFYLIRKSENRLTVIAYLMVIGGAVGNLIDRVAYGHVIDFLDFDFFDFIIHRWPVFNIADSAITIAIVLLIIDLIFFHKQGQNTSATLTH